MVGARGRAVVLGASIAGMLAARVLADFYESVTVVERDVLPDGPQQRRGVPQGRHIHGLLSSGSDALDILFPGLLNEIVADGAVTFNFADPSLAWVRFGGHDLYRGGRAMTSINSYSCTRPFLEAHIRGRLRSCANVSILDGRDVVELIAAAPDRVTGILIADRRGGKETTLNADLVVDAMGRGARTPAFLEKLGYGRPVEEGTVVHLAYSSQLLRIPPGALGEKLVLVGPTPQRPTAVALAEVEDDAWMLTVSGMAGVEPPTETAALLAFAEQIGPPPLVSALQASKPISEITRYRYPVSQRRRYERMRRFPSGLLLFGDAMCSFNPIYAQGMSVAALEALTLRECLQGGDHQLTRRFFQSSAKPIGTAWQMANGADLAQPQVEGRRSLATRASAKYTDGLLAATTSHLAVTEQFLRVMHLIDPPSRLLRPSVMMRVALAPRRRSSEKRTPSPVDHRSAAP